MKAVILAAGYATRLRSVTNNGELAKPLLEITAEGKTQPILYFLLDKFFDTEFFDEVIVITNNKYYKQFYKAAHEYEKTGKAKCPINVLNDGTNSTEEAKGANGDLLIANNYIPAKYNDQVFVVAGDNYFDFSINKVLEFYDTIWRDSYMQDVNVVVSKHYPESEKEDIANKFGILDMRNNFRVVSLDEKPGIENIKSTNVCLATYIFNRADFALIDYYYNHVAQTKKERDSLGYFINYIIHNTMTFTYPFEGTFIDIGSPEDYYSLTQNPNKIGNN